MSELISVNDVTNGGEEFIKLSQPYTVEVSIEGTSDLLFHRWNCEAVEEKARAKKGSEAKKTDNIESYVYRNDEGEICLPGEYLRQAVIKAAKFQQDPRSPRKSAMDLYKAGVQCLTPLSSLGSKDWDYLHKCRVMVQRNGINRTRPAFRKGWKAQFDLIVLTPEYISRNDLREAIERAGKLIGVGDYIPTYGRFGVVGFR